MNGSMLIYGLDFTSAPSKLRRDSKHSKRLLLAVCTLDKYVLQVERFECLNGASHGDFSKFDDWLKKEGEWFAGLDFPMGQPEKLISDLNWPKTWVNYVDHVSKLEKAEFERVLEGYKKAKPVGQKELRRETDRIAGAISPMKLYGVPVGKMFFQGATRLLRSDVSIHPIRPIISETRHVIEAYPKLVACKCLDKPINKSISYKSDDAKKRDSQSLKGVRKQIVDSMCVDHERNNGFTEAYGIRVVMGLDYKIECIEDPSGDCLDSVLCAVQAAWSYSREKDNYGIPQRASLIEGWICDPQTLRGSL